MFNDQKKSVKNIIVEGNIGAGKSTFLKLIEQNLNVDIVFEPHKKWQDVQGHNILDSFYKDTNRWAYTFQTYAFVSRVVEQEISTKNSLTGIQILERSVYSDRYCFAKNCHEMGVMSALEWQLYKEWFSWLVDGYVTKPDGFIYIQADPEVCYKRLLKRSRSEEEGVSLSYLQMLHQKHEDWLVNKKGISENLKDIPVLVLSCNKDFENDIQEQEKHAKAISDFFEIKLKKDL